MSSRRATAAVVPNKTSTAPVSASNRAVLLKSSIQIHAMRPPTSISDRSEVTSRLVTSKSVSKDLVTTSNKLSLKTSASSMAVSSSKPLWHSVKSLGSRVAPGSIKLAKEQKSINNKEEQQQMVSSTGTESSGIFSDSENNAESLNLASNNNKTTSRILRPPQTSTSRLTAAMAKTTSKLVKRPPPPNADQAVIVELRNQIHLLKNQHDDQLEQLNREHNDKFQKEMAIALAEKEIQFQQQLAAKEADWRAEWTARLEEERRELERQLAEEKAAQAETAEAAVASLADERRTWQQRIDVLLEKTRYLLAEKERLDKNIRQEVETQVQATVQKYNKLQKETTSLQAVCDLRCEEARTLRQELEKVTATANEVPHLRERISTLGNMVEGLKAQLEQKTQEERRLQSEVTRLELNNREESMTAQRLAMDNEQLWYKLQSLQRRPSPTHSHGNDCDRTSPTKGQHQSSPFHSTAETPKLHRRGLPTPNLSPIIAETSKDSENNNNCISSQVKRRRDANSSGNGASASSDVDDVFSPVTEAKGDDEEDDPSPTVRDFTKKNDSVSYVLDLGGEHSPTGPPPLSATYLTPGSPWIPRRNLTRSASLRYPHRPYAHH